MKQVFFLAVLSFFFLDKVKSQSFINTDTQITIGMLSNFKQNGKFYMIIPDSIIGREILLVSRLAKSAADLRGPSHGYAGDQIKESIVKFEKSTDNRIVLQKMLFADRVTDTNSDIYGNFLKSNKMPVLASFKIEDCVENGRATVIDVTDFFQSDSETLYFSSGVKEVLKLGNQINDRSYIESMRSFPLNTEVSTVKTYMRKDRQEPATFEINTSFVMLPKSPMKPRYLDERVGFFDLGFTDYAKNPQGLQRVRMATRWRLEPKPEDRVRYFNGELVEPVKPIIFYIDPTTPRKWIPYLIQGVNDWQIAFERAGFKNAIFAREAPSKEEDPSWSVEDARNNVIVYKSSFIENASGPHVLDPRSGEIIESHVSWHHNIMRLLRNWYFIQCSPVDTAARHLQFDNELMGQLIRFVSSHEIGHVLGLRHNLNGSSHASATQLRDSDFLEKHGHTSSIMDYSRFNFVAQPGDRIPRHLLFPRIGDADLWSIEWGYRYYDFSNIEEETKYLLEKTTKNLMSNPRIRFSHEFNASDPRSQAEDLGSNQMETGELAIKNLKFINNNLLDWLSDETNDYQAIGDLRKAVQDQYIRYLKHVAKWIGGRYENPSLPAQGLPVYTYVSKKYQKQAMDFIGKHLFVNQPFWLAPEELTEKTAEHSEKILTQIYMELFPAVLNERILTNLESGEGRLKEEAYSAEDLFNDLNRYIWDSLAHNRKADIGTRIMQKTYIATLMRLYHTTQKTDNNKVYLNLETTEQMSLVYYQLKELKAQLQNAKPNDITTRAHYAFLAQTIML